MIVKNRDALVSANHQFQENERKFESQLTALRKRVEEYGRDLRNLRDSRVAEGVHEIALLANHDRYRTALEEILEDRGRYMTSAEIADRHHEIAANALER